jgi:hypothetical protein
MGGTRAPAPDSHRWPPASRFGRDDLDVGMTQPDVVVFDADEPGEFWIEEIDRLKQL